MIAFSLAPLTVPLVLLKSLGLLKHPRTCCDRNTPLEPLEDADNFPVGVIRPVLLRVHGAPEMLWTARSTLVRSGLEFPQVFPPSSRRPTSGRSRTGGQKPLPVAAIEVVRLIETANRVFPRASRQRGSRCPHSIGWPVADMSPRQTRCWIPPARSRRTEERCQFPVDVADDGNIPSPRNA